MNERKKLRFTGANTIRASDVFRGQMGSWPQHFRGLLSWAGSWLYFSYANMQWRWGRLVSYQKIIYEISLKKRKPFLVYTLVYSCLTFVGAVILWVLETPLRQ